MNNATISWFKSKMGIIGLSILPIFFAVSCSSDEVEIKEESAVSVQVQTAEISASVISQIFPGRVESKSQANLSTIVMGTVTDVPIKIGDHVQKGDILIRIKDDQILAQREQLQANRVQAKANLENTEKNYNRIKNLFAEQSATSKELDDVSTMYEIAKANMEELEARLNEVNEMLQYTVIRAPYDGIISRKMVSSGDMASPGQPLVSVTSPSSLKITANVPEKWIGNIQEGDSIQVSVASANLYNIPAILYAVSEAGDPASRQFAVEAEITDTSLSENLKPGMFAEVQMHLVDRNTLTIPQSAIVQRGQLTGIYTLSDDNKAVLRWIKTGAVSGGNVEVLAGLKDGEQYVVSVDPPIRQGQLLSIQ